MVYVLSVLALDLATHTGYALASGVELRSGFITLDRGGRRVRVSRQQRVARLWKRLTKLKVDVLVLETPQHFRSIAAAEIAFGLYAVANLYADQLGIEVFGVQPTRLKRWATGSGAAKKLEMVTAARAMFPAPRIYSNDQADALLLLGYYRTELVQ